MQSTSSVRTFQSSKPEEPKKPKKEKLPKPPKAPRTKLRLPVVRLPWLLVAALVVVSMFMFVQYRQAKHKLSVNTPAAVKQQTESVTAKVGKLYILPKGQTPTVATVLDVSKLQGQAFFANAQNGDKVLVYNQTKQAILYRPSTNQLVNVATVTTTPSTSPTQ